MSSQRLLLDTGPLLALLADHDERHRDAQALAALAKFPRVTCWPVITEAAYLLQRRRLPAEASLTLCRSNDVVVEQLITSGLEPEGQLLGEYRSLGLQLADACLLQLSDRLDLDYVLSVDRGDFAAARTPRGRSLTILPDEPA